MMWGPARVDAGVFLKYRSDQAGVAFLETLVATSECQGFRQRRNYYYYYTY